VRVLVTAGPTREHVDDVRFLSNVATGRTGYAVAEACLAAGHDVILVTGPGPLEPPDGPEVVRVVSALEMRDAVLARFGVADAVVMNAAVADYRPAERIRGKRKKGEGDWNLRLVRNPDILAELGARKGGRILVGFALEAEGGEANARAKLERKNLDAIVLNAPSTAGAERSDFTILRADGTREHLEGATKPALARHLLPLF